MSVTSRGKYDGHYVQQVFMLWQHGLNYWGWYTDPIISWWEALEN